MKLPIRPVHINYRVLASLLMLSVPALGAAGFVVIGVGQTQLRRSYGQILERTAERTAAAVDTFVFRRVIDVATLTRVPVIQELAASESAERPDSETVLRIDQQWQRLPGDPPPEALAVLNTPASRFLSDVVTHDLLYREILVTDRHGRLVAASGNTTDYYQADERWWREVANSGHVSVSDVTWDESAGAFGLEITMVIPEPSGKGVAGLLKALVDTQQLFATIVGGAPIPGTGDPVLVRRDGTVVFSRDPIDPRAEYFAANLLRERLQKMRPGDVEYRSHFSAESFDGRPEIVALAPTQIARSYSNLPWLVAVSESEDLLFAPVRAQIRNFLLVLAMAAILFLGAVVWWSMRLAALPDADQPEMELHLVEHPRVRRIDDTGEAP